MSKRWIQKAVKKKGRVRTYMRRRYGDDAFNKDGTIKYNYLVGAIADLESRPRSKRPKGLLQALFLAKHLKSSTRSKG